MDGKCVECTLEPAGIMFSEFYFYLTAFIAKDEREELHYAVENDHFPTIYRIDRIENFKLLTNIFMFRTKTVLKKACSADGCSYAGRHAVQGKVLL